MFLLFFFINLIIAFNAHGTEANITAIKDLDKILKQEKYNRLVDIEGGKIEVNQIPEQVYLFSNSKYYTVITFSVSQVRNLTRRSKKFMEKWSKAKYSSDKNNDKRAKSKILLTNNQIDMFYKEISIVEEGKLYNFIIQVPILEKMKSVIQTNEKVQVELMYLGKNYDGNNNFFMITDFSLTSFDAKKTVKENDFVVGKKLISSGQYAAAIQKLELFIKKFPDHFEAKKNFCLAKYLNSIKNNNIQKNTDEILSCYEGLLKMHRNSEIYYTIASLYYTSSMQDKNKYAKVLEYSDKAVDLLESSEDKYANGNMAIYCRSVYLRGLSKIYFKDNDGMMDIENVQNRCPELISVNIFSHN